MDEINPFQPPTQVSIEVTQRQGLDRVARNIRAICWIYVFLGVFCTLGGPVKVLSSKDPFSIAVGSLIFLVGLGSTVSTLGVLNRKSWGIPMCRVMAVILLTNFPLGTILSVYFLYHIGKVKEYFR